MKLKQIAAAALFGGALIAASPAFAQAQEKLTVWWGKGFYKAEDDALYAAIKKFEAKYPKYKVELSLYAPQEMIPWPRWTPATRRTWPTATSTTSR
jgi:multiple sugar transport system substrate-binding protein